MKNLTYIAFPNYEKVVDILKENDYLVNVFPDSWKDAQEKHQLLYSETYRDLQLSK